jgi:glycosyltransferase involved in cell wall biosynthesis
VVYLPNGVDDAFFDVLEREDARVAVFSRPRLVFAGTLGDWIDYAAITATARRLPGASILLAGAGNVPRGLPANVHALGAIPYERLPALISSCDAGLVPFLRTPRTEAASSNKIFQYLACGLPVIASRTTEIEQTGAPVAICDSAEEFAQAVALALGDPATEKETRIAFARRNTWAKRAAVVRSVLGI